MIDLERIDDLCQRLALGTMATHLAHVAEEAVRKEWSYREFLERLLQTEHRRAAERSRVQLTKTAGFPAIKTLEQYDFGFATGTPKAMINKLTSLAFVNELKMLFCSGRAASAKHTWRLRSATRRRNRESRRALFRRRTLCCNSPRPIGMVGSRNTSAKRSKHPSC